jgi:hypothetical protein
LSDFEVEILEEKNNEWIKKICNNS